MADSLIIANSVEVLGGGQLSQDPLCQNAMFRLQPGADPGAPQPTTDFVASLLLDGERPFGRRSGNRTIKLPIWITAPDRRTLAAAREVLEQAIDQDQFTITWTRDPGPGGTPLPMILDCYRAQPTTRTFSPRTEQQLIGEQITLTIPAMPYGRSDTQQQIAFASPVPASPPPPPAPVILDTFATIASPQCSQGTQCIVGPYTACWDPDDPRVGDPGGQVTPFVYGPAVFTSPQNLAGLPSLQLWAGFGSRYYQNLEYRGRHHGVRFAVTLTDISGNQLSFSRSRVWLPVSQTAQAPVFSRVTIPIPQTSTAFNYAQVASWQMTVTNRLYPRPRLGWVTCYLDHLQAIPPSTQATPVTRGFVYTLQGLVGTARAPLSLTFQQPPGAGTVTTLSSAGPGTYTVPAGTAWGKVEATGGGGAGATMTVSGVGPGGAGAEYAAEPVFPMSAGQQIPYSVGAGGQPGASPVPGLPSIFGPGPSGPMTVIGNGGASAGENSSAAVPGASGSGNLVENPGGAGRANPAATVGGGGGSAGSATGPGLSGIGAANVAYTSHGSSNWTCLPGVFLVYAETWGAGGGGGVGTGSGSSQGAAGGGGEYRAAWVPVTPGNLYPVVVGQGGLGGTTSGASGAAGTQSSFTGDSGDQVVAYPGGGGAGGHWGRSGGGYGGWGGIGLFGFPGGQGGPAYPFSGGGGSCAAPNCAGNPGGSPYGAIGPPGAGGGGQGSGAGTGNGTPGAAPGGGGGGTYSGSYVAGNGADGMVRLTFQSAGAPTTAGGLAVGTGGAGGAGGGSPGTAGTSGSAPGGGGGGADSGGTTVAGGVGATGLIKVTPYSPQPFKSLIVHRPPLGAPKSFQPLVSVGGGSDAPDGTHQYVMPQLLPGVQADFSGTYTVYLVNASWNGSGARTITVTVTQAEYGGGATYTTSTIPVTVTPSQVVNGILTAGVLTLPVKQLAPDNTAGYFSVSVTDTNTSDRFYDAIFLDTQGSTIVINEPSSGYISYYVDEPDPVVTVGNIMGSQIGRPGAISVTDNAVISGPPMAIEPTDGDCILFAYSADGVAPSIAVSYSPRWFFDRYA